MIETAAPYAGADFESTRYRLRRDDGFEYVGTTDSMRTVLVERRSEASADDLSAQARAAILADRSPVQ